MKAQFVNLQAAADYMGPGAIEIDRYQPEITDIVRRRGPFGQRIKQVPATGHPSRFFEETGIPSPSAANGFVDPRNITPTLVTPTRVERSVPLKCLVSQINYNVFDIEVGAQQSQFAYLQAKDLADSVEGLLRTHDVALWNGNDTSLSNPTTPQYYGAAGQITDGGGLDLSGVQDVSPVNQFLIVPQKTWTEHVQELATITRASYRAHDGKLYFEEVGQQSFTISEQDEHFVPEGLLLLQSDQLRNDVTIIGELEPLVYVRDYFLGNGATLGFYLSESPFSRSTVTVFQEDYTATSLKPTLWSVTDPNGTVSVSGGQLQINGGPATVSFVEPLELAGGLMMQHGQIVFNAASSGTFGAIYNGPVGDANCIAGFAISPNGTNSSIQGLINGSRVGSVLGTVPGHVYGFTTQLVCNQAHRVHQTYLSSTHPAGNGRGGDALSAAMRVVLAVHDVDPANPGTLAAPATVLYDDVLPAPPGFATYALANGPNLCVSVSFTRLQHVVDTEVRSLIPGGQFRTRLTGNLADGGECYVTSSAELRFYPPYPPQQNEEVIVAYRSSARAMARVQDTNSIAAHHNGSDSGRRSYVRRLKLPLAPTSIDCENAAVALLDDAVQPAWAGEYRIISDFLPVGDVIPANAVQISAPSRGAVFTAIVREVELQVISLRDDRSEYLLRFSNDAAESLAFEFETMMLTAPLTAIFTTTVPSSSLYLPPLTAAQVTNVIATEITVDAGIAPPPGGGIEVRRSNGGWGAGSDGNLAGRFNTQTFILPRLSRVQGYYMRQYDASSPVKYSRDSALLYVDYPL